MFSGAGDRPRMPGWCLCGGLEFAAACDFRIAAHDARFGSAEGQGRYSQRDPCSAVTSLIGWGRARWLVMTAENIDAPTALAWGWSSGRAARWPLTRGREHGGGPFWNAVRSVARAKSAAPAMARPCR